MAGEELASVLIGAFLIALGCASVLVSTLRSRRATRILLSFGLAAGLYGLRLLAMQPPVRHEDGMMLGVFPDAQYTNTTIAPFGPGDRLLLYSDGVPEARDRAGQYFDGERVARWMSASSTHRPSGSPKPRYTSCRDGPAAASRTT